MRRHERYGKEHAGTGRVVRKVLPILGMIYLVYILSRLFLVDSFAVQNRSMLPGLQHGDTVFVNSITHGLRLPVLGIRFLAFQEYAYGERVAALPPENGNGSGFSGLMHTLSLGLLGEYGKARILRVLAKPGDLVRVDAAGIVQVNGKRMPRKFSGYAQVRESVEGNSLRVTFESQGEVKDYTKHDLVLPSAASDQDRKRAKEFKFAEYEEGSGDGSYRVLYRVFSGEQARRARPGFLRPFPAHLKNAARIRGLAFGFQEALGIKKESGRIQIAAKEMLDPANSASNAAFLYDTSGQLWYKPDSSQENLPLVVKSNSRLWLQVPEDSYFLLADNRDEGKDSRSFGPVSEDAIYGSLLWQY